MSKHIRVMVVTLLVMTGILVFLPSSYVSAGGWVVNQDFEVGVGDVPTAWNLTGNATRINSGPIYDGNWSARITDDGDTLTQWVNNITGFAVYDGWGWIYVTGNVTGVIAFDFWRCQGCDQLSPTVILSATDTNGGYVQRTSAMQAPGEATSLRIRLLGTGWDGGAEVRFDDVGFYVSGYGCFIATAAYGTETASQLDILRDFRDQVLLDNALGSRFVEAYYELSPPVANFIAKNDFLRAVVREVIVDPVVNLLKWSQNLWRA